MFVRALVLRNTLKRFMKTNTLACINDELTVVKVTRVGFTSIDVEFIDEDMLTSIQTGTLFIGDLKSVRSISTYMARVQLLNSNPDLLLEDSLDFLNHDCEFLADTDED